ncbi:hydrogenase maturation nickel metallochaperone HypA/HybF [Parageobacillus thermoglucosidasius]|uniref:Hydrogenase maturation factor HypA n=3 Tax=Anoxybacillaceae TaxID=3120669 RepID=A0AB38R493_PARTM|nr:hydrogenase maturation nickel metallochaperone HypA [Parageobacillus thermoglucosidasius]AEH48072.1 hydrogenase expression/synthesis HypA [Parageobacillus thermoglucosidasius C56-YS93]ALF10697.1 hydrogenase nickel incorporation protein HypA [Parageobacillus thermoglucosidasius]ANZ30775.1 hydrogenase nickel incorporation protein HypA [Parageobacillus thermoglucosidasius]APM81512.1 hydrogenase nickel incorporation protein HypA [Parageobacillus thermoglucosidasius]KJX69346.1 hydrogenase nickel
MHELALMEEIVRLIEQDASKRNIGTITKVELLVGELSNALPAALEMAFDVYKLQKDNRLAEDAQLIIHFERAKAFCPICGQEYEPQSRIVQCPSCLLPSGRIIAGEAFRILTYEGSLTS